MTDLNCEKYSKKAKKALVYILFFLLAFLFKDLIGTFVGSIIILISGTFYLKDTLPYIKCLTEYNKRSK
jgi:hypothetical protein